MGRDSYCSAAADAGRREAIRKGERRDARLTASLDGRLSQCRRNSEGGRARSDPPLDSCQTSQLPSPRAPVCMPQSFDEWCRNLVILR